MLPAPGGLGFERLTRSNSPIPQLHRQVVRAAAHLGLDPVRERRRIVPQGALCLTRREPRRGGPGKVPTARTRDAARMERDAVASRGGMEEGGRDGLSSEDFARDRRAERASSAGHCQPSPRALCDSHIRLTSLTLMQTVHPRLIKMHMAKRLQSLEKGEGLDFATAEALAFGSLLLEGYHVRLCGQDSGRVRSRTRAYTKTRAGALNLSLLVATTGHFLSAPRNPDRPKIGACSRAPPDSQVFSSVGYEIGRGRYL